MKALLVVAVALVESGGSVLMQQRPHDKAHGGLWEFPGGKVEPGETLEDALVREIDEELGVRLDPSALFPISFASEARNTSEDGILLLLYGARHWHGTPRPLEPGSAIQWVDAQALAKLPMPPLDVPLAQAVTGMMEGLAKGEAAP